MKSSEQHSKREAHLISLMQIPTPEPKYKLWQCVLCDAEKGDKNSVEARICGLHFVRVALALEEECEPGWRYHIELVDRIEIIHEDEIKGAASDADTDET